MTYLFFRQKQDDDGIILEVWYPLDLKDDADAVTNGKCNTGTIRVENINGQIIWSPIK